jgi:hypothetical protein
MGENAMIRSVRFACSSLVSLSTLSFSSLIGCDIQQQGAALPQQPVNGIDSSSLKTVNIPHSSVKWQSIGNCWAYAAIGWLESMLLRSPDTVSQIPDSNFSETYITYRHYELQLANTYVREVQTGGSFQKAAMIMQRFGLISEGDFIPEEADLSKSDRQKVATKYLNESLKSGALSRSRTPDVIRAELDAAFGVKLQGLKDKIIPASSVTLTVGNGKTAPLSVVLDRWQEIDWPLSYSDYPEVDQKPSPSWNGKLTEPQISVMRRVMRAMNANYPVVVNWFVDFRAMNSSGVFDLKTLKSSQNDIRQGFHSTVLEDYIAEGKNPLNGERFETPEGEVSSALKSLAARSGTIKALIVKNSWGGSERLDRPSYSRDGEMGYHKLGIDYLLAFLPQYDEDTLEFEGYTTGVNSFILPVGF